MKTLLCMAGITATFSSVPAATPVVGEVLHGFKVREVVALDEVPARLVRMEYALNGADLVWLDRADDNKTFAIVFKTPPEDDTGVAHILEHSVLCGSRKYPLKEPFVDLAKSSLATFLNAMTWPDKTGYPVSSRNDRDLLNLADVYLDAVFHPLSVENDRAFLQEGWHYEYDGTNLTRKGVVYSEMKGSYSNPNSVAWREMMKQLFPSNTYSRSSGGDPAHIPELTFDRYRAFHAAHYHPSNARIFLDGAVDLDAMLALLDSYLRDFPRRPTSSDIAPQPPVSSSATVAYESAISVDRAMIMDGWCCGTFADRERNFALEVLARSLASSNEDPLKKALVGAGLCEDVDVCFSDGMLQSVFALACRNVRDGKTDECRRVARATLERLARGGLDRARLAAIIDNLEFHVREKDTGTYPRGLAFMGAALDLWLYGGNPADAFRYEEVFRRLRAMLSAGGFERLLNESLLANSHHVETTLVPSTVLADERRAADVRRLASIRGSLSAEELSRIAAAAKRIHDFQSRPDDPAASARLPRLAVKDVSVEGALPQFARSEENGVCVLRSRAAADGIAYLDLGFSLAGLTDDELLDVPFLATVLGELATTERSALDLATQLDGRLGRFSTTVGSHVRGPCFHVHVSALLSRLDDVRRLTGEVLLRTRYDDRAAIAALRAQMRESKERSAVSGGDAYAMRRSVASFSEAGRVDELLSGFAQIRRLQGDCKSDLASLAHKIFTRARMFVAETDNVPVGYAGSLADGFPVGEVPAAASSRPFAPPAGGEGFVVTAPVAYAALGAKLPATAPFCGSQLVASRILTYDYLWREIREKGGAYGMGLYVRPSGNVVYRTYRDPNPARSYARIAEAGDALEKFVVSGESFEKYQVATIGAREPYRSPRAEAERVFDLHLSGRGIEDLRRERREILGTSADDLTAFARTLKELSSASVRCVVGGAKNLEPCKLGRVEPVVKTKPR